MERGANVEATGYQEKTTLDCTSMYSKIDVVRYLVSKGTNKTAKTTYGGSL